MHVCGCLNVLLCIDKISDIIRFCVSYTIFVKRGDKKIKRKKIIIIILMLFASLFYLASTCDKQGKDLPQEVLDMLTDEQIEQLKKDGLNIYEGQNPPNVEGAYLADNEYCVYSSDGDDDWYTYDYYYNLTNQSGDTLIVAYNGGPGSDISTGDLAYISGDGDNFSIFVESHGIVYGITYTDVTVYSGTIAADGIHDFQFGFIMTSKGDDPYEELMDVGEDRIFIEDDGLAERLSSWPFSASDSVSLNMKRGLSRNASH